MREHLLRDLWRQRVPEVGLEALEEIPPHLDAVGDLLALVEGLWVLPVLGSRVVKDRAGHQGTVVLEHLLALALLHLAHVGVLFAEWPGKE